MWKALETQFIYKSFKKHNKWKQKSISSGLKQPFISEYRKAEKPIGKTGAQPRVFQAIRVFLELEHFDKYFFYNTRNKNPEGKNFWFFLLETLKNIILKEKLYS